MTRAGAFARLVPFALWARACMGSATAEEPTQVAPPVLYAPPGGIFLCPPDPPPGSPYAKSDTCPAGKRLRFEAETFIADRPTLTAVLGGDLAGEVATQLHAASEEDVRRLAGKVGQAKERLSILKIAGGAGLVLGGIGVGYLAGGREGAAIGFGVSGAFVAGAFTF